MNRPLPPMTVMASDEPTLFLYETVNKLNQSASFPAQLSSEEWTTLCRMNGQSLLDLN